MISRLSHLLPYLVLFHTSLGPLYADMVQIKVPGLQNKCLDVAGAGSANGTKVQIWDCNGTKAQQFEIVQENTSTPPPPVNPPPTNPPPTNGSGCDGIAAWTAGKPYKVGEKVVYKNQLFTVANDNPGYDPVISHWFWTAGDKCDAVVTNPPPPTNPPPTTTPNPNPTGEIAVYNQSWTCGWASNPATHCIATVPSFINTQLLAFVKPDASYQKGSNSFAGTGLDFSADFAAVKGAISIAKGKGQNVILSVGGATYHGWASMNVPALKAIAEDLGVTGIDIDWEGDQVCGWGTGGSSCPKDGELTGVINKLREAFPEPFLLTAAVWSTGAFGPAPYQASSFKGNLIGGNFGSFINPLRMSGSKLNRLYLMSYDAGGPSAPAGSPTGYNPKLALQSYKDIYKGPVVIGIEGGNQAWGGHVTSVDEAADLAKHSGSAMFWSLQKAGTMELIKSACRALGKQGCDAAAVSVSESVTKKVNEKKRSEFHFRHEK